MKAPRPLPMVEGKFPRKSTPPEVEFPHASFLRRKAIEKANLTKSATPRRK